MQIKTRYQIRPMFYMLLAVSLLVLPVKWVVAWIVATGVHEAFHYFALRAFGIKVCQVEFGCSGARMQTTIPFGWQEVLCAAAGPLGSFLLTLFAPILPRVALCGAFHGIYNLLPVYPQDGGRILKILFGSSKNGKIIRMIIESATLILLTIAAFWCWIRLSVGPLPVIISMIPVINWIRIKIPCKPGKQAVQ